MLWLVVGLALAEPVEGEVRQTQGQAVAGARIQIEDYRSGEPVDEVRTDQDGYWTADLPRGTYRIRVSKQGFEDLQRPIFVAPVDGAVGLMSWVNPVRQVGIIAN